MIHTSDSIQEELLPFLKDWLFQMADDKLVIGHRDSEWLGLCPDIEGDVAFSSIAQDEVGHAVFFYNLLHELGEADADTLAFMREPSQRRNAVLLEKPNENWVYSVVRHLFYDVFDQIRMQSMLQSAYTPLRYGAQKILNEEKYHLLHLTSWFTGLATGNQQAKEATQEVVTEIWPDLDGLFQCGMYEHQLLEGGVIQYGYPEIQQQWILHMKPLFEQTGLPWPGEFPSSSKNGRWGEHTEHLTSLLSTMTEVVEIDRHAIW